MNREVQTVHPDARSPILLLAFALVSCGALQGGIVPRQLAYLRVTGQRCLYNVWSQLGRSHLEALLGELRVVDASRP